MGLIMNKKNKDKVYFCGNKYKKGNAEFLCLSPLPVVNECENKNSNEQFVVIHDRILELLSVKSSNRSVGLIQLGIISCVIISIFFINILLMVLTKDLYAIFGILLPIIGGIYIVYFAVKDLIDDNKDNMPIRFNYQKKSVLISYIQGGLVRPTFFGGMNNGRFDKGSNVRLFFLFFGAVLFPVGFSSLSYLDKNYIYFGIGQTLLGLAFLIYSCYPLFKYFINSRNNPKRVKFLKVKWEDIEINFIKYDAIAMTTVRTTYALAFTTPLDNNEKYLFTIPVWSKQEALELFSFINEYMENGLNNISVDYVNQYGINHVMENDESTSNFLIKVFNIITFRNLSYKLVDKLNNFNKNGLEDAPEVAEWMRELPLENQVSFSKELQEVNSRVRKLYKKGHHWEDKVVQDIIREYDDITVQRVKCQTDTE